MTTTVVVLEMEESHHGPQQGRSRSQSGSFRLRSQCRGSLVRLEVPTGKSQKRTIKDGILDSV